MDSPTRNPIVLLSVICDECVMSVPAHTHRACPRTVLYTRSGEDPVQISVPRDAKIMIRHLTMTVFEDQRLYLPRPGSSLTPWFSIITT